MPYRFVADLVVILHFLWILFILFGAFWGRRNRLVRTVHVSALAFALLLETFAWYCPLTYLEVWLRTRESSASGYAGDFVVHYLERLIYIELPRPLLVVGTLLLIAGNASIYLRRKR